MVWCLFGPDKMPLEMSLRGLRRRTAADPLQMSLDGMRMEVDSNCESLTCIPYCLPKIPTSYTLFFVEAHTDLKLRMLCGCFWSFVLMEMFGKSWLACKIADIPGNPGLHFLRTYLDEQESLSTLVCI